MIALGYLGALIIGIVLGLIGGGGSILTVPIFVYLFDVNPILYPFFFNLNEKSTSS